MLIGAIWNDWDDEKGPKNKLSYISARSSETRHKQVTGGPTDDRQTDQPSVGQPHPHIEMRRSIWACLHAYKDTLLIAKKRLLDCLFLTIATVDVLTYWQRCWWHRRSWSQCGSARNEGFRRIRAFQAAWSVPEGNHLSFIKLSSVNYYLASMFPHTKLSQVSAFSQVHGWIYFRTCYNIEMREHVYR